MYFVKKYNLLFIAIPKTGTTSVENALRELDDHSLVHELQINGRKYKGSEFKQGILGHARAKEIAQVIGEKSFCKMNTMTFIRHPHAKLVSAYFFNKNNQLKNFMNFKGSKKIVIRKVSYIISVLAARVFPFKLWALLYPYKSNYGYIFDDQGRRLVKYIGRTERLNQDFKTFLDHLRIDYGKIELGVLNSSLHKDISSYFNNRIFNFLINMKIKKDLELYNILSREFEDLDNT